MDMGGKVDAAVLKPYPEEFQEGIRDMNVA